MLSGPDGIGHLSYYRYTRNSPVPDAWPPAIGMSTWNQSTRVLADKQRGHEERRGKRDIMIIVQVPIVRYIIVFSFSLSISSAGRMKKKKAS